jgi:hypothetical protein
MVRQSQFSCEAVERPGEAKAEMEPQTQPTVRQCLRRSTYSPPLKYRRLQSGR